MNNVSNLIAGILDVIVLAMPSRKNVAMDCMADKRLRYALNAVTAAFAVTNLWIFAEANTNMDK